ncbi:Glycerol-3-phosphate acyltransferase 4, partial [Operophtera brumata]
NLGGRLKLINLTESVDNFQKTLDFHLSHCLDLVKAGMESIIEDQVTQYEFLTWRLTIIWAMGFIVRYMVLLPLRIMVLTMIVTTSLVSLLPPGRIRRYFGALSYMISIRTIMRGLSCTIYFHDTQYKPKSNGFCVANHTSPIDVGIVSVNTCFSLIGQRHSGFLGLLQRALARASPHIWFERSEAKDRNAGTCINNTSVMQFKKGSFEVGGTIYPVAINSWAIVCDVWYLPPMTRGDLESAVDFANRVK